MKYPIIQRLFNDALSDEVRDDVWGNLWNIPDILRTSLNPIGGNWLPKMDIDETDKNVLISVSVPGVKKEDVKVDISDNILTVSGERKEEKEEKNKKSYVKEQFYGSFKRSVKLPFDLKADAAKANYKDGMLKISIPKSREVKSKSIAID